MGSEAQPVGAALCVGCCCKMANTMASTQVSPSSASAEWPGLQGMIAISRFGGLAVAQTTSVAMGCITGDVIAFLKQPLEPRACIVAWLGHFDITNFRSTTTTCCVMLRQVSRVRDEDLILIHRINTPSVNALDAAAASVAPQHSTVY